MLLLWLRLCCLHSGSGIGRCLQPHTPPRLPAIKPTAHPTPHIHLPFQDYLPPVLHATFLAAVTEFVWLPWKAAQEAGLALEGATQGGSQVGRSMPAVLRVPGRKIRCDYRRQLPPAGPWLHPAAKAGMASWCGNDPLTIVLLALHTPARRCGMPLRVRRRRRGGCGRRCLASSLKSC